MLHGLQFADQGKFHEEAPRERLLHVGSSALRADELLAVIIQTGGKHASVLEVSLDVLNKVGGIYGLLDVQIEELMRISGIGMAKALQICAAVELGRRIHRRPLVERFQIRSANDVALYVMDRLRHLKKEHFVTLYLDTKHKIIGEDVSSVGSLDASIVHPREIFMPAVRKSASAIVCIHNHPSGDPTPSQEDISVTRRLLEAGRILGIDVLDHIIIGDGQYISLKEQGHV